MTPDRPIEVPAEGGVRQITLGEAVDESLQQSRTWVENWRRLTLLAQASLVALLVAMLLGALALLFLKGQNDDLRERLGRAAATAKDQRATIDHLSQTNDVNERFFCIVRTELVLSIQGSASPQAHTPQAQQLVAELSSIPLNCSP